MDQMLVATKTLTLTSEDFSNSQGTSMLTKADPKRRSNIGALTMGKLWLIMINQGEWMVFMVDLYIYIGFYHG
jgi:hypothetical protein